MLFQFKVAQEGGEPEDVVHWPLNKTVSQIRGTPRGLLRVSAPFTLAGVLLVPALPEFLVRRFPSLASNWEQTMTATCSLPHSN